MDFSGKMGGGEFGFLDLGFARGVHFSGSGEQQITRMKSRRATGPTKRCAM